MSGLHGVFEDLAAESEEVDRLVAGLDAGQWSLVTPAPGWTIAHQVAHLAFVFRLAGTAASDPEGFGEMAARAKGDFDGAVNAGLAAYLEDPPETLLARWRAERDACVAALAAVPEGQVVPWLVNPLPAGILACAGIMELFGHGQDIADALGVSRVATDRLEHLVGFAVLTMEFGYQARGLAAPGVPFRFEITLPSGRLWAFGPEDAEQRVWGPAVDFCQLVTRRRHPEDLAVRVSGSEAERWLYIAQAYRGPAGPGRRPGQFAAA